MRDSDSHRGHSEPIQTVATQQAVATATITAMTLQDSQQHMKESKHSWRTSLPQSMHSSAKDSSGHMQLH